MQYSDLSLYERIGGETGVIRLTQAYLAALRTREDVVHLRSLYSSDMSHYETRMIEYLTGWLGGPALYLERHGMPMLRENHRRIPIDEQARDQWMVCMREALAKTVEDVQLRILLEGAFWRMADSLRNTQSGIDE